MNSRVFVAALVGAIVYFLLGWLFYGFLLNDFYAAHSLTKYYIGLEKMPPNFIGIFASGLAYTLLLAIIFGYWSDISTVKNGAIAGTAIGLLFALSADLGIWSMYNLIGRQVVVADVLVNALMGAIIGTVIAMILGYKKTA